MTQLQEILKNIPVLAVQGNTSHTITNILQDSRKVEAGSLFVAVKGTQTDGHQFLAQVIEKQASAIIYEADIDISALGASAVTWIKVRNSAEALALAACNFYGNPSRQLKLVGITGTNGKTTTVTMLYRLFRALGYNVGLLSTVENRINDEVIPATHTTPDAVTLNALLAKMVAKNCQFAFMEVSSHALVQQRVAGIQFAGAIFSNITHDHLDYHHTFDEYIKAKKLLFDGLPKTAFALVNKDDKRAAVMLQNTAGKTYSFALKTGADFKARILDNSLKGLHLDVNGQEVHCKLIGEFNAYNLMGIYGAAVLLGEDAQ
ncbi:MAG: UDP-N-acetylmuramoyl-L-alanyl-D-glutamate--2,6-diaminopimelate ligase, partial [Thermoflexibacteraceae bacterium]